MLGSQWNVPIFAYWILSVINGVGIICLAARYKCGWSRPDWCLPIGEEFCDVVHWSKWQLCAVSKYITFIYHSKFDYGTAQLLLYCGYGIQKMFLSSNQQVDWFIFSMVSIKDFVWMPHSVSLYVQLTENSTHFERSIVSSFWFVLVSPLHVQYNIMNKWTIIGMYEITISVLYVPWSPVFMRNSRWKRHAPHSTVFIVTYRMSIYDVWCRHVIHAHGPQANPAWISQSMAWHTICQNVE